MALRAKNAAPLTVQVSRKDGFTGPIRLTLQDPPPGFTAAPVSLVGTQTVARLNLKTSLQATPEPVELHVVGTATIAQKEVVRPAIPAEDRMQAFLWRHLVPASQLLALVFDPAVEPPAKRTPPPRPTPDPALAQAATNATPPARLEGTNVAAAAGTNLPAKPKFTKQQVAGRLRQLKALYEEGLLTDEFYAEKVAECDAVQ